MAECALKERRPALRTNQRGREKKSSESDETGGDIRDKTFHKSGGQQRKEDGEMRGFDLQRERGHDNAEEEKEATGM